MIQAIGLIAIILLFAIVGIKVLNLFKSGKLYSPEISMGGLLLGLVIFGLLLISFVSSIGYQKTTLIDDPSGAITVTTTDNEYESVIPLLDMASGIFYLLVGLTVVEIIQQFALKWPNTFRGRSKAQE